jgi:cyclopropane fatty-acyl-phospholipid synthase-like methyltransferase
MSGFDDARAFWDQRFAAPEYIFGTEPNAFLAAQAQRLSPGMRVLDVACGEGRNAVWLARQGCRVTAFDISPLALQKARRLAAEGSVEVEFHEQSVDGWQWHGGAFDAVVCIFIQFAEPAQRERLFQGFHDTLVPGGLVLLQGYTPKQLEYRTGGPGQRSHLYTAPLLREAFARFELLELREHEQHLAEGSKHVGMSALVNLVARKRAP